MFSAREREKELNQEAEGESKGQLPLIRPEPLSGWNFVKTLKTLRDSETRSAIVELDQI